LTFVAEQAIDLAAAIGACTSGGATGSGDSRASQQEKRVVGSPSAGVTICRPLARGLLLDTRPDWLLGWYAQGDLIPEVLRSLVDGVN
jgi:hypothetical protein